MIGSRGPVPPERAGVRPGWPTAFLLGWIALWFPCRALQAQNAVRGRIAGRVVDAASGQPVAHVQVSVADRAEGAETDLDGRYIITPLPAGRYIVRARRIGYQAKQVEGVVVANSDAVVVDFAIATASVALEAVVVSEVRGDASASEASLLAIQQRAAAASDGISAEQIKRTPDANAGDAAVRVSGISVVDSKFVVVRGLSERYSTTLVNGVDVASPEPAKKIVPLDIFPSSLLESIVVSKAATPDKPGDFSGGAVEVNTKEFPDDNTLQFSVTQSYNSRATFERLPFPEKTFSDNFGLDRGRRRPPALPSDSALADPFVLERYAEGFRHDWQPRARTVPPNLGASLTYGGQRPHERFGLGYVFSLNYSAGTDHVGDRFFQFYSNPTTTANRAFVYQDYRSTVDWGGVANVTMHLGAGSKAGFKNFYSRNAEDLYSTAEGFAVDRNGDLRTYQRQYIERDLLQSQITGEHLIDRLASSRFEWKATISRSGRDEPDNRQVSYTRAPESDRFALSPTSDAWVRTLHDRQTAFQADWTLPARLLDHDFTLKAGGLARKKVRDFHALIVSFNLGRADQLPGDFVYLPPEQAFTPENIGNYLTLQFPGALAQPYDADDKLTAWYGMLDTDIIPRVRLVGGVRQENWTLDLFDGGRDRFTPGDTARVPLLRRDRDLLWSANATVSIAERMNLRLAGFLSVARPDTRELSLDEYTDVIGSCATIGNPSLERTKIRNADARWEWYPRPGEVLSVSGFYKSFDKPIIRVVIGRNGCTYTYENATSARNVGLELDARKDLTFLPGPLARLSAAVNYTRVKSTVRIDTTFGVYNSDLTLEGQSPFLANASLSYQAGASLSATVLYNLFDDRIVRYGFRSSGGDDAVQGPNIVEQGRGTLDAKVQKLLGRGLSLTIAGRNLTDVRTRFYQQVQAGKVSTGTSRAGATIQLGISYAR